MRRLLALALAVAALIPFLVPSPPLVEAGLSIAMAASLAQAWNLVSGFPDRPAPRPMSATSVGTRPISLGHAAFFGAGAYAAAAVQTRWALSPWLALLAGPAIAACMGALAARAAATLGTGGFALITLGLAEACRAIAGRIDSTTGALGILIPMRPGLATLQLGRHTFYAAALLLLLAATALAWWRTTAARPPAPTATLALSAALTALGGVLSAQLTLYVDPANAFAFNRSLEIVTACVLGGPGTLLGPILGAIALHGIASLARTVIDSPAVIPLLDGAVLLAALGLRPGRLAQVLRA